jgi:hypothetical protein
VTLGNATTDQVDIKGDLTVRDNLTVSDELSVTSSHSVNSAYKVATKKYVDDTVAASSSDGGGAVSVGVSTGSLNFGDAKYIKITMDGGSNCNHVIDIDLTTGAFVASGSVGKEAGDDGSSYTTTSGSGVITDNYTSILKIWEHGGVKEYIQCRISGENIGVYLYTSPHGFRIDRTFYYVMH